MARRRHGPADALRSQLSACQGRHRRRLGVALESAERFARSHAGRHLQVRHVPERSPSSRGPAVERARALADREALARQVASAETDPLTGARTRAAGLSDLERELARCRRVGASLVIAYIDVIGLKSLNDSAGHGAGDELLKRVVTTVVKQLRPYDLVVRVGGDEFVCAMSALPLIEARRRFASIATALASAPQRTTIRTGIAQLEPNESVASLIARADGALVHSRSG